MHSTRHIRSGGAAGLRWTASAVLTAFTGLALAVGPAAATHFAFVVTTDYFTTGSSSAVHLDGSYSTDKNVASIHSDAVARYYNGLVYVVNRMGGDNIQILDPDDGFSTVRQFSVGNGSNPTDIAFLSKTKAYVTRYNTTDLWIVDPSTGTHLDTIDMSSFADADGCPEMDQLCMFGNYLYVTIQRLDQNNYWVPVGTSYVAVIDVAADTLLDTDSLTPGLQPITLTGTNPFSELQPDHFSGRLFVSCVGYWGLQDGGVEAVNPETFQSEGYILTETETGGDVTDFEIVSEDKGYVIISDASFNNVLLTFNTQTGDTTAAVYSPGGYVLTDIEQAPSGELFLTDRTPVNPGIRIYDIVTDSEITSNPIDVGLPPFDIAFSVNPLAALGPVRQESLISMGPGFPNPFRSLTTIPFALERGGEVNLSIFDATGRLVRTLLNEIRPAGAHRVRWDGRDGEGRALPAGLYFAKLDSGELEASTKLVLLK
jgi:DNA-binding beta-propeller fold protein YncE